MPELFLLVLEILLRIVAIAAAIWLCYLVWQLWSRRRRQPSASHLMDTHLTSPHPSDPRPSDPYPSAPHSVESPFTPVSPPAPLAPTALPVPSAPISPSAPLAPTIPPPPPASDQFRPPYSPQPTDVERLNHPPETSRPQPPMPDIAPAPSYEVLDRLLKLVNGDRDAVTRLLESTRRKYPDKPVAWIWEKVLRDLERDRQ